jgi:hypothetical protein
MEVNRQLIMIRKFHSLLIISNEKMGIEKYHLLNVEIFIIFVFYF